MQTRQEWIEQLGRIVRPVLSAAAEGRLREAMRLDGSHPERARWGQLEALGRSLYGLAPWLDCEGSDDASERAARDELAELARRALRLATAPGPARLNFSDGAQPLVDAAFLAAAVLRAPRSLWAPLDDASRAGLLDALRETRAIAAYENNWLLFSALVEALIGYAGAADWRPDTIRYALQRHEDFYVGDGIYGDGPFYHQDYYNSFVIQPSLLDLVQVQAQWPEPLIDEAQAGRILTRARRYAAIQERMIMADGSYPLTGRSICYRAGAFQTLAWLAWREALPAELAPGRVRAALAAVIARSLGDAPNYRDDGFLEIGVAGAQPGLAESYINTGSLYLCTAAFLPLGLAPTAPFWADEAEAWTARRVWAEGRDQQADRAYDEDPARRT